MNIFCQTIGGAEMRERWRQAAAAAGHGLQAVGRRLALYLDDLLLLAGGGCFVRAAWEAWGRPAALAVAGVCLVAYALVIARSRGGGGA